MSSEALASQGDIINASFDISVVMDMLTEI